MEWQLLTEQAVIALHDAVLEPNELVGMAGNKSLAGALGRVEYRIQYGLVDDVFDLAAMYAVAVAQAHVFNDANKRTAYMAMKFVLRIHGETLVHEIEVVGTMIVETAQGTLDETALTAWLRTQRQ